LDFAHPLPLRVRLSSVLPIGAIKKSHPHRLPTAARFFHLTPRMAASSTEARSVSAASRKYHARAKNTPAQRRFTTQCFHLNARAHDNAGSMRPQYKDDQQVVGGVRGGGAGGGCRNVPGASRWASLRTPKDAPRSSSSVAARPASLPGRHVLRFPGCGLLSTTETHPTAAHAGLRRASRCARSIWRTLIGETT